MEFCPNLYNIKHSAKNQGLIKNNLYLQSTNLYGSHPVYINMNPESATGYGFFWLNSNAMGKFLRNPSL